LRDGSSPIPTPLKTPINALEEMDEEEP